MAEESPSQQIVVIRPSRGWSPLRLKELVAYRELLYFLVWRDLKVRYKGTVLGVGWAVLQPLLLMVTFTLLFGVLIKIPSDGIPYAVFAYAGILPWTLFVKGLTEGSLSLATNEQLITKVYFPRPLLPISSAVSGLVDFAIAFVVLLGLMLFYGILPTLAILVLPLFIAIAVISAMGVSFWLSSADILYRDVRHTIPFIAQFWFFVTPVVYPLSIVPDSLRWLYSLNPMVAVVEGFRWALVGGVWPFDLLFAISLALVLVVFVGGLFYFRRTEKIFADWGRPG